MKRKQPNDKTSNYNLKHNVSVPECATAIILVPVFQYGGQQIFTQPYGKSAEGTLKNLGEGAGLNLLVQFARRVHDPLPIGQKASPYPTRVTIFIRL